MADTSVPEERRVVILNPASGSGDHATHVRQLAGEYGFDVEETSPEDGAVQVAERVADRVGLVAAAGGDGTVNEVVRGVRRAGALEDTTVGVVPAGTGNNFAEKIGVEGITQAFDVLLDGERRRIDLGVVAELDGGRHRQSGSDGEQSRPAGPNGDQSRSSGPDGDQSRSSGPDGDQSRSSGPDGSRSRPAGLDGETPRPFVNSCVCGVTAEASSSTDSHEKQRIGTLAYLVNTLREVQEFDPIPLEVRTSDAVEARWEGEAIAVLIGNGRRFPAEGTTQADMEDGRFDVTILEAAPALDLVGDEARRRLLAAEADHLTRLLTPALDLSVRGVGPQSFSLDGEILDARDVHIEVESRRLRLCVGEGYEPHPGGTGQSAD